MTAKDPYKGSPYDAAGMPLRVKTVDYDKKDDVAKTTVKDKPAPEVTDLASIEFEDPNPLSRKRPQLDPDKFNGAVDLPIKDEDQKNLKSPEQVKKEQEKAAKKAEAEKAKELDEEAELKKAMDNA